MIMPVKAHLKIHSEVFIKWQMLAHYNIKASGTVKYMIIMLLMFYLKVQLAAR